jgi:hypothetical protein
VAWKQTGVLSPLFAENLTKTGTNTHIRQVYVTAMKIVMYIYIYIRTIIYIYIYVYIYLCKHVGLVLRLFT